MSGEARRQVYRRRAVFELLGGPVVVVLAYLVLRAVFVATSEDEGLIAPSGVRFGVAAVGAAALCLRVAAVFGAPAWIAYRLVVAWSRPAVARWRERRAARS
ncbi:MAG: hypothetical protein WKG00_10370 [Polyangiaceae bacterium]